MKLIVASDSGSTIDLDRASLVEESDGLYVVIDRMRRGSRFTTVKRKRGEISFKCPFFRAIFFFLWEAIDVLPAPRPNSKLYICIIYRFNLYTTIVTFTIKLCR